MELNSHKSDLLPLEEFVVSYSSVWPETDTFLSFLITRLLKDGMECFCLQK